MSFAILRTKKLKKIAEIASSLSHTYRTRNTPNADPNRLKLNSHVMASPQTVLEAVKARLPEKVRSNGVRCVEYLITASPDWSGWGSDAENTFFEKSVEWLKKIHGEENVIATSIHRDETTPHLIAYVVPIDSKGNLNCRHFLGGKDKLSKMQTDFHCQVQHLGLERGLEGSKAEHRTVKQYYADIQKPIQKVSIPQAPLQNVCYADSKIHAFDSRSLKDEKLDSYFQLLFNDQYSYYQEQALRIQESLSIKLSEKEKALEREVSAHKKAVSEIKRLEKNLEKLLDEFSLVIEYKKIFPKDFRDIEEDFKNSIFKYEHELAVKREREKFLQEKLRQQEIERKRELEREKARYLQEKIQADQDQRFDRDMQRLLSRLGEMTTAPEKMALEALKEKLMKPVTYFKGPYAELYKCVKSPNPSFEEKINHIRMQYKYSKEKKFDDNEFGFYDTLESAVFVVATQRALDSYIKTEQDYEKALEAKEDLSEIFLAKCEAEYKTLFAEFKGNEEYRLKVQAELSRPEPIRSEPSRPEKTRGFDFDF